MRLGMHASGKYAGSRPLQGINGGLSSRSTPSLPCCRLLLAQQVSRTRQHILTNPAAAAAAYPDAVPYISSRAPKLRGRSISGNPLHWGWSATAAAATQLELLSAVWIDRFSNIGPPAVAVLAGALAGLGTTPWALLQHGMPPALQDHLLAVLGIWDTSLFSLALAVTSAPVALWVVRCWWAANIQLCTHPGGLVQQLLQAARRGEQQQQEDDKDSPSPQQQHNMLSIWLAAPVMLVRLWCLKVAAAAITTLAAGGNGTHQALHAAAAVAATAVAAAPLLWPVLTYSSSSSSNSNDSSSSPLLTAAVLLAAEAACVTCTASPLPVVSAAAGCVIAASLLLLHNRLVAPRLLKFQANVGDAAKVHVALKLQGSTAVFDSTKQEEPLDLFLQPVPPELHQLWQDASSTAYWEDEGAQQQLEGTAVADNVGKQAAAAAAAAGNDGEGDTTTDSRDLYTVQQGIQGWLRDPAARWDALTPFIADAAAGMYLGQTRSVAIYNPLNVGYWNPRFTWWQPTADVMEKFKGQVPQVGEVFWYPVADGAYVPTRIQNVGEQYVELDANYGVTGTSLQLEVQLVRLYKPGDADEAGGEVVVAEAAGAADD